MMAIIGLMMVVLYNNLVGGKTNPTEKNKVSWDDYSKYMEK